MQLFNGKTEGQIEEDKEYNKKVKISSQFCWNGMIVSKEHLVRTMRTAYVPKSDRNNNKEKVNSNVSFLPITYDLSDVHQLQGFITDFTGRENMIKRNKNKKLFEKEGEGGKKENENENKNENENANENINVSTEMDNIWIMKRYRGRQSMDYPITDNLSCALRHLDSAPRLACKYVSSPSLWKGRKYDLRYYVIVLSLEPLILYRHKMFVIRVANYLYAKNDFEQYQKHFTVMNFVNDSSCPEDDSVRMIRGTGGRENPTYIQFRERFNMENSKCFNRGVCSDKTCDNDFIDEMKNKNSININNNNDINNDDNNNDINDININNDDNSINNTATINSTNLNSKKDCGPNSRSDNKPWESVVQPAIDTVLRQIFEGVSIAFKDEPVHPSGQPLHKNACWSINQPNVCPARAMYGIDVILSDHNEPMVLEVQWAPDCAQAVVQNPSFWNEILGGLFLNDFEKFVAI